MNIRILCGTLLALTFFSSNVVYTKSGSNPAISVSPDTLNFGNVFIGYDETLAATVRNLGLSDTLLIYDIHVDTTNFASTSGGFTLPPESIHVVYVTFHPQSVGLVTSTMSITSNDAAHPVFDVVLRGVGIYPPGIAVQPDSLEFELNAGDSAVGSVTIHNAGLGQLNFSLSSQAFHTDSSTQYTIPLELQDSAGARFTVRFGIHPNATYGIDWDLGEYDLPPFPPGGLYATFVDIPGRTPELFFGTYLDLRPTFSPTLVDTYQVRYLKDTKAPVTLSWPSWVNNFVENMRLIDLSGGSRVNVNMLTTTTTIVSSPFRYDNLLIISERTPKWLAFSQMSGDISPGESQQVTLTVRTENLVAGRYRKGIEIASNDPAHPTLFIPVNLHLIGIPNITVSVDTLAFGTTYIGYPDTLLLRISNAGRETLHVSGMSIGEPGFQINNPQSFSVAPFGTHDLPVVFAPTDTATYHGTLVVRSDDPGNPIVSITLMGHGADATPNIRVSDDTLDFGTTYVGFPDTLLLRISNVGFEPLHVSGITVTGPGFEVHNPQLFSLTTSQTHDLLIVMSPTDTSIYSGTLVLQSNDPNDSLRTIRLMARGAYRPIVAVSHESLSVAMKRFDSTTVSFTISNHGAGTLHFSVDSRPDPVALGDTIIRASNSLRTLGNIYTVNNRMKLQEFCLYLDINSTTQLTFSVFVGHTIGGVYHHMFSKTMNTEGIGKRMYSSGPIDIFLQPGEYYYCVASYSSSTDVAYYGYPERLPVTTPFGSVVASVNTSIYPEPDSLVPLINTMGIWYQSVRMEPLFITSISPDTGIVPPGGSLPVTLRYAWDQLIGIYTSQLVIHSNDLLQPEKKILCTLTAMLPNYIVEADWNLLSVPVVASDYRKQFVFPDAVSPAYTFTDGYQQSDTLHPGVGYWLKFPSQQYLDVGGNGITVDTFAVHRGWNMIGSLTYPVRLDHIAPLSSASITSLFYGYSGTTGYSAADSLIPGKGYWVRVNRDGKLVLKTSPSLPTTGFVPSAMAVKESELLNGGTRKLDNNVIGTLKCTDARNRERVLTLKSKSTGSAVDLEMLELPPAAEQIFDVRFASQRQVEFVDGGAEARFPIQWNAINPPLTLSWEMNDEPYTVTLETKHPQVTSGYHTLQAKGTIVLPNVDGLSAIVHVTAGAPRELPKHFALSQNYPNPFNPSTTIRYELPVDSWVILTIFNILGQKVETLIDENQSGGYKIFAWHAAKYASGIYFCKLEAVSITDPAKSFTGVRKMVLMK